VTVPRPVGVAPFGIQVPVRTHWALRPFGWQIDQYAYGAEARSPAGSSRMVPVTPANAVAVVANAPRNVGPSAAGLVLRRV
jgi:hypothetical protein